MMATDYYGKPSCGYDTFVTRSSKRSVATQFSNSTKWIAGRAAQIYGRRTMAIAHFSLRASGDSGMEDIPSELDLLAR
jgi:hypothetical protein